MSPAPETVPKIPAHANAVLVACALVCSIAAAAALPLALLPRSAWWGWLLVPLALATNTLWALIHEAIHGLLFPGRRLNDAAGRILSVCFGTPFRALRAGHLLHHRYSRTPRERAEVYDERRTPRAMAATAYYARLCGGLYAAECLGALACLLPARTIALLERRLDREDSVAGLLVRALRGPGALAETRADCGAIVALAALAISLYGRHAWMLAAAFAARAFLVSVFDNAWHYATPLDRPREANSVAAAPAVQALLLNFNLHGAHHRHPRLPWSALPAALRRDGGAGEAGLFRALLRQFRGPIPLRDFSRRP